MEKGIINTSHEDQCEDSFSIPVELDFTEFDEKLTMMQEALSEVLSDVLTQAIVDPDSSLDLKELLSDENTSDEEKNFADYEYEEEDDSDEEDSIYDEEDSIYDEEDNIYDEENNIYDEEDDYYDDEDDDYEDDYDEEDDIYDEEDNIYDEEDDDYDDEDEDDIYDEEDDYYDDEDNIYNHRDKTSRSSHFTPLFGSHKSQSSHGSTSRNASSYNPFDTHGESSFDWTDRDGDGYDDRDDGFWTEREF